jgi:hypothetical protein
MIWLRHTAQLHSMPSYETVGVVEMNMIFDQKYAWIYIYMH